MAATLPVTSYKLDDHVTPHPKMPERRRVAPWADRLFGWLAKGAAFLTLLLLFGIMLSLLVFIGEAVRDAFNPRKVLA